MSFTDASGVQHSVEVVAGSLYEAAAMAVAEFRRCPYLEVQPGIATTLTITVKPPVTSHQVKVGSLNSWLASAGKSLAEQSLKGRLKEMLNKQ